MNVPQTAPRQARDRPARDRQTRARPVRDRRVRVLRGEERGLRPPIAAENHAGIDNGARASPGREAARRRGAVPFLPFAERRAKNGSRSGKRVGRPVPFSPARRRLRTPSAKRRPWIPKRPRKNRAARSREFLGNQTNSFRKDIGFKRFWRRPVSGAGGNVRN